MITNSLVPMFLRSVFACLVAMLIGWVIGELNARFTIPVSLLIYIGIYVQDVGTEITNRLKELNAFLPGDDEHDENTE